MNTDIANIEERLLNIDFWEDFCNNLNDAKYSIFKESLELLQKFNIPIFVDKNSDERYNDLNIFNGKYEGLMYRLINIVFEELNNVNVDQTEIFEKIKIFITNSISQKSEKYFESLLIDENFEDRFKNFEDRFKKLQGSIRELVSQMNNESILDHVKKSTEKHFKKWKIQTNQILDKMIFNYLDTIVILFTYDNIINIDNLTELEQQISTDLFLNDHKYHPTSLSLFKINDTQLIFEIVVDEHNDLDKLLRTKGRKVEFNYKYSFLKFYLSNHRKIYKIKDKELSVNPGMEEYREILFNFICKMFKQFSDDIYIDDIIYDLIEYIVSVRIPDKTKNTPIQYLIKLKYEFIEQFYIKKCIQDSANVGYLGYIHFNKDPNKTDKKDIIKIKLPNSLPIKYYECLEDCFGFDSPLNNLFELKETMYDKNNAKIIYRKKSIIWIIDIYIDIDNTKYFKTNKNHWIIYEENINLIPKFTDKDIENEPTRYTNKINNILTVDNDQRNKKLLKSKKDFKKNSALTQIKKELSDLNKYKKRDYYVHLDKLPPETKLKLFQLIKNQDFISKNGRIILQNHNLNSTINLIDLVNDYAKCDVVEKYESRIAENIMNQNRIAKEKDARNLNNNNNDDDDQKYEITLFGNNFEQLFDNGKLKTDLSDTIKLQLQKHIAEKLGINPDLVDINEITQGSLVIRFTLKNRIVNNSKPNLNQRNSGSQDNQLQNNQLQNNQLQNNFNYTKLTPEVVKKKFEDEHFKITLQLPKQYNKAVLSSDESQSVTCKPITIGYSLKDKKTRKTPTSRKISNKKTKKKNNEGSKEENDKENDEETGEEIDEETDEKSKEDNNEELEENNNNEENESLKMTVVIPNIVYAKLVGIHNEGNTCFFNTHLQFLYHIPEYKKEILDYQGDSQFILSFQSMFNKLDSARKKVVSIKDELVILQNLEGDNGFGTESVGVALLTIGHSRDSSEFAGKCIQLMKEHKLAQLNELFKYTFTTKSYYYKNHQQINRDPKNEFNVIFSLALPFSFDSSTVKVSICFETYLLQYINFQKESGIEFKEDGENGTTVSLTKEITYKFGQLIFCQVSRYLTKDENLPIKYTFKDDSFSVTISGYKYIVRGFMCHPGGAHYIYFLRKKSNVWYKYNDSTTETFTDRTIKVELENSRNTLFLLERVGESKRTVKYDKCIQCNATEKLKLLSHYKVCQSCHSKYQSERSRSLYRDSKEELAEIKKRRRRLEIEKKKKQNETNKEKQRQLNEYERIQQTLQDESNKRAAQIASNAQLAQKFQAEEEEIQRRGLQETNRLIRLEQLRVAQAERERIEQAERAATEEAIARATAEALQIRLELCKREFLNKIFQTIPDADFPNEIGKAYLDIEFFENVLCPYRTVGPLPVFHPYNDIDNFTGIIVKIDNAFYDNLPLQMRRIVGHHFSKPHLYEENSNLSIFFNVGRLDRYGRTSFKPHYFYLPHREDDEQHLPLDRVRNPWGVIGDNIGGAIIMRPRTGLYQIDNFNFNAIPDDATRDGNLKMTPNNDKLAITEYVAHERDGNGVISGDVSWIVVDGPIMLYSIVNNINGDWTKCAITLHLLARNARQLIQFKQFCRGNLADFCQLLHNEDVNLSKPLETLLGLNFNV